jgi:hypothetical protein
MLAATCPRPFALTCVTDQPRDLPSAIDQIDCSNWHELRRTGMRPTTVKLGLFNPAYVPYEEFFYLDLSLVIRSGLGPLLDAADCRPEPLVIVSDWCYDCYNSSVMRIRNRDLVFIYEAFAAGEKYPFRNAGDQDFIHAAVRARGLQNRVATFPPELVASFKLAARPSRCNRELARRQIADAVIVKFCSRPKPHELLQPYYRLWKYGLGYLPFGALGPAFSFTELDRTWSGKS